MRKLLTLSCILAVVLGGAATNTAQAHLVRVPDHPQKSVIENRLNSQTINLKHARYVCHHGANQHKRWACKAIVWISAERRETKALLTPKGGTPHGNVALGKHLALKLYGWDGYEWEALYALWNHESGWDERADNPSSDACGIPQRMDNCANAGYNPYAQILWGLHYIKGRYGAPSGALSHLRTHNYY